MRNDFVNSVDYIASWITKNPDKAMLRISEELAEAEARGYQRGVEDAIAAGDEIRDKEQAGDRGDWVTHWAEWSRVRPAIRALLERTGHANSPHP
jgi:hypothetical protein